jgi:hypothetical protein
MDLWPGAREESGKVPLGDWEDCVRGRQGCIRYLALRGARRFVAIVNSVLGRLASMHLVLRGRNESGRRTLRWWRVGLLSAMLISILRVRLEGMQKVLGRYKKKIISDDQISRKENLPIYFPDTPVCTAYV